MRAVRAVTQRAVDGRWWRVRQDIGRRRLLLLHQCGQALLQQCCVLQVPQHHQQLRQLAHLRQGQGRRQAERGDHSM